METTLDVVSEILLYYQRAKRFSRDWHKQIVHRRKLYNQDHYTSRARQGEERYEDPTYTNVVDLAVGIILANDLEFKAFGWTPSQQEQDESDRIEKLLAGLIQANNEREELFIPYEVLLHFVRDGAAVLYSVWDTEIAKDAQISATVPVMGDEGAVAVERRSGYKEPPLRLQVIDPLKIFLIPGGPNRWLHVFRVDQLPVQDVEMMYGIHVRKYNNYTRDQKEEIKGELIDYWRLAEEDVISDEMDMMGNPVVTSRRVVQHALIFENEVIFDLETMDNYDDLPYTIGFFKPTDRNDPNGWGQSIIDPLESTVAMLERAFNRRQFQITRHSALPLVVKARDGRTVQLDPALGQAVTMNTDEDIAFPQWSGNPPDVELQIGFLRARAQQSGFSDILFGAGPSQVSGYALSQMGDQNRIRLEQPVQHLQLLWSRWAKKALSLVERFAQGSVVRVYGQMRGKEFMEQIVSEGLSEYNVRVYVKPEFPNEKVRKHAMATQVKGIVSDHTLMQEYLDIEQPGEERKRRMIEAAQNHPIMMEYAIMNNLRQMAEDGDETAGLVLMRLVQGGGPSQPPGPAPQGRNPEQAMGLASPNGSLPPQAAGGSPPGQGEDDAMSQLSGLSPNMSGMVG